MTSHRGTEPLSAQKEKEKKKVSLICLDACGNITVGQDTGKRTRNVVHAQNLAKSALRPTYSHKKLIDAIGVCLLTFVEYNR